MTGPAALDRYRAKRDFAITLEPDDAPASTVAQLCDDEQ